MKKLIISTTLDKTIIIIRFMVGFYFLAGGVLKLYIPGLLETGYFLNLGFASAGNIAITISIIEILCGILIMAGLYTRIAAITLMISIVFIFIAGKVPVFYEEGFFLMAHLSRIDFAMFLGCVFLVLNGSGYWSLDHVMGYKAPVKHKRKKRKAATVE